MQSTSRKRTRNDVTSEIPGVPNDVAPFLTAAIVETTKAMKHISTLVGYEHDITRDMNSRVTQQNSSNTLDNILDRFQKATESRDDKQERRLMKMKDAITAWETTLKRNLSTRKRDDKGPPKSHLAIPLASFLYVWNLQEHVSVPVRRASLYIASNLLVTNDECRICWIDNHMLQWIKLVVEGRFLEQHASHVPLWQTEARLLLSRLTRDFSEPQIKVGLRVLQQRCPRGIIEGGSSTRTCMGEWRYIRDFALEHGEKEIAICEKLIRKAHYCMEALMPRLGIEAPQSTLEHQENAGDHAVDEEDDEDIDWEDGDEAMSEGAHLAAVEHTLAVMQSTGDLRGGDLEIDFQQAPLTSPTQHNESTILQKGKLIKVVQSLSTRHMARLSSWVNALSNADNLIQPHGQDSLVAISTDAAIKRGNLLLRLLALKSSVSSVLNSSAKLNIKDSNNGMGNDEGRCSARLEPSSLAGISNFQQRYNYPTHSSAKQKQMSLPTATKRIQIKYRL